ncbi:hypothetical protein [Streptomyces sp. NPDC007264]|uniref:hypothetical protein n=1 Tax=Streptomyces sp. NPDC007264 TaxID=3364777 RepID=UPI0036DAAAEE
MFERNLAVVLIFAIVLAAACYAISQCKSTPARVVAVIAALATLVGALTPAVKLLVEQPQAGLPGVQAPEAPAPSGRDHAGVVSPGTHSGITSAAQWFVKPLPSVEGK